MNVYHVTGNPILRIACADQEADRGDTVTVRDFQPYSLSGQWNNFPHRSFHHHWIGQVDEMNGDGSFLTPDGYIDDTRAADRDGWLFVRSP